MRPLAPWLVELVSGGLDAPRPPRAERSTGLRFLHQIRAGRRLVATDATDVRDGNAVALRGGRASSALLDAVRRCRRRGGRSTPSRGPADRSRLCSVVLCRFDKQWPVN